MKLTGKILACLGLSMCFTTAVLGQKHTKEADDAFEKGFYFNAVELYKNAYSKERTASAKAEILFKTGEAYRALREPEDAQIWYEKAIRAQYPDAIAQYYVGQMLMEQGKYAEAIVAFNKYKERAKGDQRADAALAAAAQAQTWSDKPSRYSVDPEVLLNTAQYDFSPTFADRKNSDVVFASSRPAATGNETDGINGESFTDLFFSGRDKLGKWSEPVRLPPSINGPGHEGTALFNSKRNVMYFTRCPYEKKKVHGCDIWITKKSGNNYTEPEKLELYPNRPKGDTSIITIGHPALTADDAVLIFSSNMPGGKGGKDLWKIDLDRNGKPTGNPVNLGATVNTSGDDLFPFIRHNGDLYFTSNGHPGMGGMDIFHAERTGENAWGNVENMRSPINSSSDDLGIMFDADEDKGYFTSNRPGGKGQYDIWRFQMPSMVFALQGTAYDKKTGEPLADTKIELVGTDGSSHSALTDQVGGFAFVESGSGRFIQENTSYSIRASKDKYLGVIDQITTVGLHESTTFVKEYLLQPTDIEITLPEVQYPTDKFVLTDAGKDSLQFLYNTLVENPTIIIELRSHTDSRNTRTYKGGNLELSQKRAQSCVNYLVSLGIDPVRMVPVGRAALEPRFTDAEIAKLPTREEKEAAHQKNRRTDFKVISFDYVPKETAPAPAN